MTDRSRGLRNDPAWESNTDVRLDPDSIAKVGLLRCLYKNVIFISHIQAYLSLVAQDSSAWAWEIDCKLATLLLL